jgi:uroporphyrinogen decarboxylase
MRQAGRYLPEYRAIRATAPDFIAFCLDPEKAAEVTLQPMRRFPFSASIVFADILLIPRALGQEVWFETGEGPRLGPIPSVESLKDHIDQAPIALAAVGETLKRVRAGLEPDRALIGFAGAPWTVLTYMLEGGSSDRSQARSLAYSEPDRIDALIDVLVQATAKYLVMQVEAGAEALQLFESWAEGLAEPLFERLVTAPHKKLIGLLRDAGVTVPIIGFPRGAGGLVEDYAAAVPVQGLGKAIQGALDPLLLRAGGAALDRRVEELLDAWGQGPYIFNLGHGILPDTPIDHVERVLARVTGAA